MLNLMFIGIIKLVVLENPNFATLASGVPRAMAAIASAIITNFYKLT